MADVAGLALFLTMCGSGRDYSSVGDKSVLKEEAYKCMDNLAINTLTEYLTQGEDAAQKAWRPAWDWLRDHRPQLDDLDMQELIDNSLGRFLRLLRISTDPWYREWLFDAKGPLNFTQRSKMAISELGIRPSTPYGLIVSCD